MPIENFRIRRPGGFSDYFRIRRLYVSAFPASERKPFGIIRASEKRGKTDVWLIEDKKGFAGFFTTVNGEDTILLDYLAVSKKKRGLGFGSACIREMLSVYREKSVFVEIESVFEKGFGQAERERRRRFYLENGFSPMNVCASVFGVEMELLGVNCRLSFDQYRAFYKENYSAFAADHIHEPKFPPR